MALTKKKWSKLPSVILGSGKVGILGTTLMVNEGLDGGIQCQFSVKI